MYKDYIDLGFTRGELNDQVVYNETGYSGFFLEKKISDIMSISVYSTHLHEPSLYIKKRYGDTYHIIKITLEIVKDLLAANDSIYGIDFTTYSPTTAC